LKKPIFGTCAGLILLAKNIREGSFGFGYIDIDVERNAYGRQVDSFEQDVELAIGNNYKKESFKAVFIRAPKITKTGKNVKVLGNLNGNAILARQESILVCAFHPELTDDTRIHSYFIDMVKKSVNRLKNQ
jgi:5'-phosphate synthase pdxT subunit